jgi:hypothetical protein
MLARLAADLTLLLHLGFIVFALFGALLAWRWRWVPWLQLPAAAWGVFVELTGRLCPLTSLENHFRRLAGEAGYAGGFIEHHLLPLIYPEGLTRELQWALAAVVATTNLVIYAVLLRRRHRERRGAGEQTQAAESAR